MSKSIISQKNQNDQKEKDMKSVKLWILIVSHFICIISGYYIAKIKYSNNNEYKNNLIIFETEATEEILEDINTIEQDYIKSETKSEKESYSEQAEVTTVPTIESVITQPPMPNSSQSETYVTEPSTKYPIVTEPAVTEPHATNIPIVEDDRSNESEVG